MINVIYKSKDRVNFLIAAYLMFYLIFLISFIGINTATTDRERFQRHSRNIFSILSPDFSRQLVITKNDSQKEYESRRISFEHFNNYSVSKTGINFENSAFAVLRNKLFNFNSLEIIKSANLRSPPKSFHKVGLKHYTALTV